MTTTPTPGAMRAAEAIKELLGNTDCYGLPVPDGTVAAIITRETGAELAELVAALQSTSEELNRVNDIKDGKPRVSLNLQYNLGALLSRYPQQKG